MGRGGDRFEVEATRLGVGRRDRDAQGARTRAAEELDVVDVESERGDGRLDCGAYRFELRVRRTHSLRLPHDPKKKRGPRPTFPAPEGAPNTTVEV